MSTAIAPIEAARRDITNMGPEFAKALPKHVTVDKFTRVVMTAIGQNPGILNADRRSLYASCMRAAQDGLLPDGREAALVTFKNDVQYLPMVAGILKKLRNSGQLASIDAAVVYERDSFEFERGDNARLVHKPYLGADDPGQIVAAYCVAKLLNGEIKREVMTRRDIEKIRAASRASSGPGWTTWYDQFAIKSVIKRAAKQLPSSSDLDDFLERDNEAMGFPAAAAEPEPAREPERDVTPPPAAAKPARPRNLQKIVDSVDTETGEVIDQAPAVDPEDTPI